MITLGIEVLMRERRDLLRGKRVGLVSNYSVVDSQLRPVIDVLTSSPDWQVVRLFGPEHGVRNSAKEGEHVASEVDPHTGLTAYSLYGDARKPSPEMLAGLDILVIDLVDIGCRYYTNMNTVAYCLEACAEVGLPCVVLDRPNPLGGKVIEGNLVEPEFQSFVGMFPIPNRHGLTMGELALWMNDRLTKGGALTDPGSPQAPSPSAPADAAAGVSPSPSASLHVVAMKGWRRDMLFPDTGLAFVPSSPNTANFDMTLLYPGTCLFEGTNLSVGRGTAHPFEVIGAPYIDGHDLARAINDRQIPGIVARPLYFVPTYSARRGDLCQGVQFHIIDKTALAPVRLGLELLELCADMYPAQFQFSPPHREGAARFFDLLAGTDKLRYSVVHHQALTYLEDAKPSLAQYLESTRRFYLYE